MGFCSGFSGPCFSLGLMCMVIGSQHWFGVGQPQWGTGTKIPRFPRDRNSLFCQTTALGSSQTCWKSSTSTGIRERISAHGYSKFNLFMPLWFCAYDDALICSWQSSFVDASFWNFKEIASSIGWDSLLIPGMALCANIYILKAYSFWFRKGLGLHEYRICNSFFYCWCVAHCYY